TGQRAEDVDVAARGAAAGDGDRAGASTGGGGGDRLQDREVLVGGDTDVAGGRRDTVGREDRPHGQADAVLEAESARQAGGQADDAVGGVVQGEIPAGSALEQEPAGGGDDAGHAGGVVGR